MSRLSDMLDPKTIALIGTGVAGSSDGIVLENLLSSGSRKVIYVSPNKSGIEGIDCRAAIRDIEEHVDLAVIAVPEEDIAATVELCAASGICGAVIMSYPGSVPSEGLEKELKRIKAASGMRIVGPGSTGIILPNNGLNVSALRASPVPGSTALISQGSLIGNAIFHWGIDNHIGFSIFASLGSMVDVDCADLIDHLQEDYFTRNIMLYLERISDAKKFISASRAFARNKPIVVLKPGRYPAGEQALALKTGGRPGSDMVYDAAFRRIGIVRAMETEDFYDTARILVSKSLPRGPRLAIVSNSGGLGIIACDTLEERGGRLAPFPGKSPQAGGPEGAVPSGSGPVDLTGAADAGTYRDVVEVCLKDPATDGVLVIYAPGEACDPAALGSELAALGSRTAKTLIAVCMGGTYSIDCVKAFRTAGIPVYETPEDAVRAFMYMVSYRVNMALLNETPDELPDTELRLSNHLRAVLRNAVRDKATAISGKVAFDFLKNYGIPVFREPPATEQGSLTEPVDEWVLRSARDIDFGTIILLISMDPAKRRKGFAVALPPLNALLARHVLDTAGFDSENPAAMKSMEETVVRFSNLVADLPEVSEVEVEMMLMADDRVYASHATIIADESYTRGTGRYPHIAIAPYPSRYISQWTLRDGRAVILRPIRSEDEPLVREMLSALTEETLRLRFFVAIDSSKMDHMMVMKFCNVDYEREIGLVVELREDDRRRIIGGGRLIVEPDANIGQFALLIADDFQKHGLGEKLLDILIGIAQDKGLREIYGVVLSENAKMIGLSSKMGFTSRMEPDGITRVSLALD